MEERVRPSIFHEYASFSFHTDGLTVSQGLFAGEVGVPRLLKLFAKYDIKTTWFIPGIEYSCSLKRCRIIHDFSRT